MNTLILCPSRGRPGNAVEVMESFRKTKRLDGSRLMIVVDEDDPARSGYEQALDFVDLEINPIDERGMVAALNFSALAHATTGAWDFIGFVGDDHRFRTPGWDVEMTAALMQQGGGLAYGNDLFQGERLPTHVLMDASIIRALGWMSPPTLVHLYVDDAWRQLGEAVDRLLYLPDIVIEHMHPLAGKAQWDEGYSRVNDQALYDADEGALRVWLESSFEGDVAKVRQAIGA